MLKVKDIREKIEGLPDELPIIIRIVNPSNDAYCLNSHTIFANDEYLMLGCFLDVEAELERLTSENKLIEETMAKLGRVLT
jgi:hypothetical protein